MLVKEEISKLSRNSCDNALLNYICENYDEIECELIGECIRNPKSIIVILYRLQHGKDNRLPKVDFSLY